MPCYQYLLIKHTQNIKLHEYIKYKTSVPEQYQPSSPYLNKTLMKTWTKDKNAKYSEIVKLITSLSDNSATNENPQFLFDLKFKFAIRCHRNRNKTVRQRSVMTNRKIAEDKETFLQTWLRIKILLKRILQ